MLSSTKTPQVNASVRVKSRIPVSRTGLRPQDPQAHRPEDPQAYTPRASAKGSGEGAAKSYGKQPRVPLNRARPAPDFAKIQRRWEEKMLQGIAETKKPSTVPREFGSARKSLPRGRAHMGRSLLGRTLDPCGQLFGDNQACNGSVLFSEEDVSNQNQSGMDFGFEADDNALRSILSNEGILRPAAGKSQSLLPPKTRTRGKTPAKTPSKTPTQSKSWIQADKSASRSQRAPSARSSSRPLRSRQPEADPPTGLRGSRPMSTYQPRPSSVYRHQHSAHDRLSMTAGLGRKGQGQQSQASSAARQPMPWDAVQLDPTMMKKDADRMQQDLITAFVKRINGEEGGATPVKKVAADLPEVVDISDGMVGLRQKGTIYTKYIPQSVYDAMVEGRTDTAAKTKQTPGLHKPAVRVRLDPATPGAPAIRELAPIFDQPSPGTRESQRLQFINDLKTPVGRSRRPAGRTQLSRPAHFAETDKENSPMVPPGAGIRSSAGFPLAHSLGPPAHGPPRECHGGRPLPAHSTAQAHGAGTDGDVDLASLPAEAAGRLQAFVEAERELQHEIRRLDAERESLTGATGPTPQTFGGGRGEAVVSERGRSPIEPQTPGVDPVVPLAFSNYNFGSASHCFSDETSLYCGSGDAVTNMTGCEPLDPHASRDQEEEDAKESAIALDCPLMPESRILQGLHLMSSKRRQQARGYGSPLAYDVVPLNLDGGAEEGSSEGSSGARVCGADQRSWSAPEVCPSPPTSLGGEEQDCVVCQLSEDSPSGSLPRGTLAQELCEGSPTCGHPSDRGALAVCPGQGTEGRVGPLSFPCKPTAEARPPAPVGSLTALLAAATRPPPSPLSQSLLSAHHPSSTDGDNGFHSATPLLPPSVLPDLLDPSPCHSRVPASLSSPPSDEGPTEATVLFTPPTPFQDTPPPPLLNSDNHGNNGTKPVHFEDDCTRSPNSAGDINEPPVKLVSSPAPPAALVDRSPMEYTDHGSVSAVQVDEAGLPVNVRLFGSSPTRIMRRRITEGYAEAILSGSSRMSPSPSSAASLTGNNSSRGLTSDSIGLGDLSLAVQYDEEDTMEDPLLMSNTTGNYSGVPLLQSTGNCDDQLTQATRQSDVAGSAAISGLDPIPKSQPILQQHRKPHKQLRRKSARPSLCTIGESKGPGHSMEASSRGCATTSRPEPASPIIATSAVSDEDRPVLASVQNSAGATEASSAAEPTAETCRAPRPHAGGCEEEGARTPPVNANPIAREERSLVLAPSVAVSTNDVVSRHAVVPNGEAALPDVGIAHHRASTPYALRVRPMVGNSQAVSPEGAGREGEGSGGETAPRLSQFEGDYDAMARAHQVNHTSADAPVTLAAPAVSPVAKVHERETRVTEMVDTRTPVTMATPILAPTTHDPVEPLTASKCSPSTIYTPPHIWEDQSFMAALYASLNMTPISPNRLRQHRRGPPVPSLATPSASTDPSQTAADGGGEEASPTVHPAELSDSRANGLAQRPSTEAGSVHREALGEAMLNAECVVHSVTASIDPPPSQERLTNPVATHLSQGEEEGVCEGLDTLHV